MATHKLLVQPTYLEFGEVAVGDIAIHRLALVNKSTEPLFVNLSKDPASINDFNLTGNGSLIKLEPHEQRDINISFSPTVAGARKQLFKITLSDASERIDDHIVLLNGYGTAINRYSWRRVDLPVREIEKNGRHFVLAISNQSYVQNLSTHGERKLDWYAALSAGTHNGTVTPNNLKPGQVPIAPEVSSSKKFGVVHGFDIQLVSANWPTTLRRTLNDVQTCSEADEAIKHTTDLCHSKTLPCRHSIVMEDFKKEHLLCARNQGEIFKFHRGNDEFMGIVISNKWLSAYYHKCFHGVTALIVHAQKISGDFSKSISTYNTTLYGVHTSYIEGIGELWIPCYTVTMMSLDKAERPYLGLSFLNHRLSRQDLAAVQERVRLYLGVES